MAHEEQFITVIKRIKAEGKDVSFAEIIAEVWGGKIVEVYIGDTYEDLKTEDATCKVPSVCIGKVVAAYAEMLVMNCVYINQRTRQAQFGNIVCLNERSVRTITEVDNSGMLKDTFLNSRDGKIIKDLLNKQ